MALKAPKLDDRQFQDIVDEAKKRIAYYCPEWTDHNVSDPGVTLIELFAWMTDMMLYRLNQVPELHYIKMMEMMGMDFPAPLPIHVPVTFWLSKPQEIPRLIAAGTEVATMQTETQPSLIFTTDKDFNIQPAQWEAVITRRVQNQRLVYAVQTLKHLETGWGTGLDVFSTPPEDKEALYFGFKNDLSYHVLVFDLGLSGAGGQQYDSEKPLPYVWEASTGRPAPQHWEQCECDPGADTTHGLNLDGRIEIHLPQMGKYAGPGQELYWIRLRYDPSKQKYARSPTLHKAAIYTWGGTTMATYARRVEWEHLGQSDGSPGQRFQLQHTPVLRREPDETLVVRIVKDTGESAQPSPKAADLEAEGEPWQEVADFADSDAKDNHYTLDSETGELRLGPAIRQPNGDMKLYGNIPPRGAHLFFRRYHYSPELKDTVQVGDINTLKTSIPYIDRVKNRTRVVNKRDKENLESLKLRVPHLLRSRGRAVTGNDFEVLAEQASKEGVCSPIGRVKCLPTVKGSEGEVRILVIPAVENTSRYLKPEELQLNDESKKALHAYLDDRRLLTTRLAIKDSKYRQVKVKVWVKAAPQEDLLRLKATIEARLYRFLNPLSGGREERGWPFGQTLYLADLYPCLQNIPGMLFVQNIEIYDESNQKQQSIPLPLDASIVSGIHEVEFV